MVLGCSNLNRNRACNFVVLAKDYLVFETIMKLHEFIILIL